MTTKNIHQRIHAAMGEVDYVQKEKKAGMNYTIVSHDAVTAKVRPILHKQGIIYFPVSVVAKQDGNRTEAHLTVRFANIDSPSDFIDVQSLGYGVDNQDKGPGKAISYAVKYALLKCLGLETGDDADHESIAHTPAPSGSNVTQAEVIRGKEMTAPEWKAKAVAFVQSADDACATSEALYKWQLAHQGEIDQFRRRSGALADWIAEGLLKIHAKLTEKAA